MPLSETLDLTRAYRRVSMDGRDDAWPDIVGYRDFGRRVDDNLATITARIASPGLYRPGRPLGINLPKKGFTLRPGVVPLISDRIAYQAIADLLAPHFEAEPCVYSNQLSDNPDSDRMFKFGVGLWLEFQERVEELCHTHPFVVETDITAYFEHIGHDLLLHRLNDLFSEHFDKPTFKACKQLLARLLRGWNKNLRFGIPQVNDSSSFFGNLYLDHLDKQMLRRGYSYLRYVDDMRLFAKDEPQARKSLAELIVELRGMGLYVGSAKTAIKRSEEVLSELVEGRGRMRAIDQELQSRDPDRMEVASAILGELFLELVEDPSRFDGREFRFCVNRFKRLHVSGIGGRQHERVRDEVLARLESMPHSTDVFVDYLSTFPDDADVQTAILDFIDSPWNIYPWQEMHLLELLVRSNTGPDCLDRTLATARRIARGSGHPACRAKALILCGKTGDYADRRHIRAMYHDEPREDVRRAVVVAIQEMQQGERNSFYHEAAGDSAAVRSITEYVLALNAPAYHYYNPPRGYDVELPYEDSDDIEDLTSEDFLY